MRTRFVEKALQKTSLSNKNRRVRVLTKDRINLIKYY